MLFWTTVRVALQSLYSSGLRSFLAMLGIIIGVGAVISMLAVGAGAQMEVTQKVSNMGTNLLSVRPTRSRSQGAAGAARQNLTLEDAQSLLAIPQIAEVAPIVRDQGQVKYYEQNAPASIIGTAVTYFSTRSLQTERGRIFTEFETEKSMRVVVIGSTLATELFDTTDPLGENIRINGEDFRVIGILKAKGDRDRDNPDQAVIVPYTVAMKKMMGATRIQDIDVRGGENCDMNAIQNNITLMLRKQHNLLPDTDNDFQVFNQAELLATASEVSRTFTVLLGSIAGISMVVGGIGIMNMMLLTVSERTREIGVRKAIGGQNKDILLQFLLESILISCLGGILGIVFGYGVATAIEHFAGYSTVLEMNSILLALIISTGVGIFFGFYPAWQAAQLDPIEALRWE